MKKVKLERLRECRESKDWTQEMLSSFSGLSVRTIQRIEKGGEASVESAKSLSAALELRDYKELQKSPSTHAVNDNAEINSKHSSTEKATTERNGHISNNNDESEGGIRIDEDDARFLKTIKIGINVLGSLFLLRVLFEFLTDPDLRNALFNIAIIMAVAFTVLIVPHLIRKYRAKRKKEEPQPLPQVRLAILSLVGVLSVFTQLFPAIGGKFLDVSNKAKYVQVMDSLGETAYPVAHALLDGSAENDASVLSFFEGKPEFAYVENLVKYSKEAPFKSCMGVVTEDMKLDEFVDASDRFHAECEPK